jgi:hypothetical protein
MAGRPQSGRRATSTACAGAVAAPPPPTRRSVPPTAPVQRRCWAGFPGPAPSPAGPHGTVPGPPPRSSPHVHRVPRPASAPAPPNTGGAIRRRVARANRSGAGGPLPFGTSGVASSTPGRGSPGQKHAAPGGRPQRSIRRARSLRSFVLPGRPASGLSPLGGRNRLTSPATLCPPPPPSLFCLSPRNPTPPPPKTLKIPKTTKNPQNHTTQKKKAGAIIRARPQNSRPSALTTFAYSSSL